jgi:hypothetical protein
MNLEILAYPAVILLMITSLGILIVHEWRWVLLLLAIQFIGVFILVSLSWQLNLSLAKLVAGWITSIVLWLALSNRLTAQPLGADDPSNPIQIAGGLLVSGRLFRFFAAALVWLVVFSVSPLVQTWIPSIQIEQVWGAFILIGLGLLHLGLTAEPLGVVLGLLTVLSGFEIVYASVEVSALVQGLLAGVNLGIGLVGAYLILSPTMEALD